MKQKILGLVMGAITLSAAGASIAPVARASQCGYFGADNGNNTIILGETTDYFWYQGQRVYYGTGDLAICYRGSDSYQHYTVINTCDGSDTSSDWVKIQAYAGADNLGPATTDGTCSTQAGGYYMWPWDDAYFDFYIDGEMGDGADRANGSEHGDKFYSNGGPPFYTGDGDPDLLCGYGGNDQLNGDGDTSTNEETMVGGAGSDTCHGRDGESTWDYASCETYYDAYYSNSNFGCSTEAPNLWNTI